MIGIVGAGEIVSAAHLPAYFRRGFPVKALHDSNTERGQALAEAWGITYMPTLDALLESPDVQVVDIAVPPASQSVILEAALKAGKHILAQKPLAATWMEAQQLVALANASHRWLLVNQQMRWSPVVRTIQQASADGRVGDLRWLVFDLDLPLPTGDVDHWLWREPRFTVLFNTLHFLDSARFLLGEPTTVTAIVGKCDPLLQTAGETDVMIALEFADSVSAWIVDRRNGFGDHRASFRASGTRGALRGHFGLWTNYPEGADDAIEFAAAGDSWNPVAVNGRWLPDAFAETMQELLNAIDGSSTPTITGADHLKTLKLVEAVYESAARGQRITLEGESR